MNLFITNLQLPKRKGGTRIRSLRLTYTHSRKTSTSALLTTTKPLTVWIITNYRKFLKEMEIPYHLTCLLRNLYAGQQATVRTEHGTTDWLQIGKGVYQGCILSPCLFNFYTEFSSVQLLSPVWLSVTPWTTAHQASLSIANSRSLPKLMSIESVMPSNHLILCHPLLLLPLVFPRIRVFCNESVLRMRWPKYWIFFISPSSEYSGLIFFRMDWLDLLAAQETLKSLLNTTVQKHQFFSAQLSL